MRYCQEKGIVCQYAGTNMHCRLTACVFPKESLYPTASEGGHLVDIEKLIERIQAEIKGPGGLLEDAATALSTLQAENEKLREKIENVRLEGYAKGLGEMSEENEELRAELEQVKQERDVAIGDIYSGNANDCDTCLHGCDYNNDCPLETSGECKYKWRGLQREN